MAKLTLQELDGCLASLESDDALTRRHAVKQLEDCRKRDRTRVVAAVTPLLSDASRDVQRVAAHTLAELGVVAVSAAPALVGLLQTDDVRTRVAAAHALGAVGDASPTVARALAKTVASGGADDVVEAARALAALHIVDGLSNIAVALSSASGSQLARLTKSYVDLAWAGTRGDSPPRSDDVTSLPTTRDDLPSALAAVAVRRRVGRDD